MIIIRINKFKTIITSTMSFFPMSKSGVDLSHPVYQITWLPLNAIFFERRIDRSFISEFVGGGALKPSFTVLGDVNHSIFGMRKLNKFKISRVHMKWIITKDLRLQKLIRDDVIFNEENNEEYSSTANNILHLLIYYLKF